MSQESTAIESLTKEVEGLKNEMRHFAIPQDDTALVRIERKLEILIQKVNTQAGLLQKIIDRVSQ